MPGLWCQTSRQSDGKAAKFAAAEVWRLSDPQALSVRQYRLLHPWMLMGIIMYSASFLQASLLHSCILVGDWPHNDAILGGERDCISER